MKKILFLSALLCCIFAVSGSELLTNKDFAKGFAGWTRRVGKGATLTADKGAAVFNGENKTFLIHYKLPVKAGKYRAEYTLSGSGKIQIYCETNGNFNGKRYYKASGAKIADVPAKAEKRSFDFVIKKEDLSKIHSFAFVVACSKSKDIRISDLSLKMVSDGEEILTNPKFERDFAGWTLRPGKGTTLTADNGAAVYTGKNRTFLVHYKLPVRAGSYRAEYTVSGSGKFRIYCETNGNINGKRYYKTSGAQVMDVPAKAEKRSFDFIIKPEDAPKIQQFCLAIGFEQGNIRISDVSLKLVSAADEGKSEVTTSSVTTLGGSWKLVNGSYFSGSGNNLMLNQIGRPNRNSSKLSGIPVKGGKHYRFTCRTFGIRTKDSTGSCAFRMTPKADGKELISSNWDDTWQGEKQIKYLEFAVPAAAKELELQFEVLSGTTVGFFDFKLEETAPKVPESFFVMTSPAYRDTVYSTVPVKTFSGKVTLQGNAKKVELTLNADGKNTRITPAADGTFSIASPGKNCRITADFFSADGKKVSSASKDISFLPPFHTEVSFDKDKFMLINGKRFFPVVFWELTAINEPDGLYYAAKRGVNCIILTSRYIKFDDPADVEKRELELLDLAHKYGIKVFLPVPSIDHLTEDKIEKFKADFLKMNPEKVRNHKAVIGYFITDEPIWRGIPKNRVINGYKIIRELDPYRAIWLNAAPRNGVDIHAAYAEGADIYGIDIYPYPYPNSHSGLTDKGLTSVGKYTDFCREAVRDRKPVWMALQGYSWYSYRNPDDGRDYPGLNHMRFMWYETLFHGGRAGTVWGTRHIRSEAFYDTLFDVTQEMHLVSGLFTKFDKVETVSSQNPDIIGELMSVGNEKYLLVRNTKDIPRMSLLKGKFPQMKQLYPISSRVLDAGKSQVSLEPFEVVIFGTAALPEPNYQLPAADPAFDKLRNPYKRVTKMDIGKARYSGAANWIWEKDQVKTYAKTRAERKFAIDPAKVKDITILITVDDAGKCFFNGKEIATLAGYANMKMISIPKSLWKAENVITVDAEDHGMIPCGVLAEIRITGTDGKVQTILSDESWTCGGKPAHIVAQFGTGAWGRRVSYYLPDTL